LHLCFLKFCIGGDAIKGRPAGVSQGPEERKQEWKGILKKLYFIQPRHSGRGGQKQSDGRRKGVKVKVIWKESKVFLLSMGRCANREGARSTKPR